MTRNSMLKRQYVSPYIRLKEISVEPFLDGSTDWLPFDQNDDTNEVLSKESSFWDVIVLRDSVDSSFDFYDKFEE